MIASTDLRIGNIVLLDGIEVKVDAPFIGKFKNVKAEPVKLSSEVLERCGLTYNAKRDFWLIEGLGLYLANRNETEWHLTNYRKTMWIGKPLLYVHQLQNIIYDLSNQEIKIKL